MKTLQCLFEFRESLSRKRNPAFCAIARAAADVIYLEWRLTENSSKMKKILVGEEKQTEDIAPAVKYKNPDAWSRSMPDSLCENARWPEARALKQE